MTQNLNKALRVVALLNLGYFGIEFAVALNIHSVSLFADSIDFLEDALVNLLIVLALSWSARPRARLGMGLAGMLDGAALGLASHSRRAPPNRGTP